MDDTQSYIDIAFEEPWLFVCLIMIIGVYRAVKFLSVKLFDENKGIITNYVHDLKTDSKQMKERIGDAFESIKENGDRVEKVQINIITEMKENTKEIISQIKENKEKTNE